MPKKISDLIIPIFVAVFNVLIIMFPKDVISASKNGLDLWWGNVFPSLLPFIIGINILTGLGIVNLLGTLLAPLSYSLFGVPGAGGFALITGMTSGYPMGAKVTAMLREKKELSRTEAQRLISFANNSGPLFIIGVVGIGMFGSAKLGYFILGVHYLSAIITGLIFRYYNFAERKHIVHEKKILSKALYSMQITRAKDGRSFGILLGDAIKDAMETITQIGGFIILFSVVVKVIEITGVIDFFNNFIANAPIFNNTGQNLFKGLFIGIIEVTNGVKEISSSGLSKTGVVVCCALISFGGFSIHAQAFNFLSKTDIKFGLYIISKLVQAGLSAVIANLMFPFQNLTETGLQTNENAEQTIETFLLYPIGFINKMATSSLIFACSIILIFFVVVFVNLKPLSKRKRY